MRLMDYMIRNDNDEEGFKKERGVRGKLQHLVSREQGQVKANKRASLD